MQVKESTLALKTGQILPEVRYKASSDLIKRTDVLQRFKGTDIGICYEMVLYKAINIGVPQRSLLISISGHTHDTQTIIKHNGLQSYQLLSININSRHDNANLYKL